MAVESSSLSPTPLVTDKTMRDPGIFTVVYSRAPEPMSLWPSAGGDEYRLNTAGSLTRRAPETPRLPSITSKPPLPKELKLVRGDGPTRWSSQLDLAKSGKLPEPGRLNQALSNSCPSVKDGSKTKRGFLLGSPAGSPASSRRHASREREPTNMNIDLAIERDFQATPESGDGHSSSGGANKKCVVTSTRAQDTQRTIHKSPSFPQSLNSLKDSKLSSNSSHSTMASNRPRHTASLTSRRLSTVSDRSPASQRRVLTTRQNTNNGSTTSRTQLTTKSLKNNNKVVDRSKRPPTAAPINGDSTPSPEMMDINGVLVPVPEGMSKEAFKLCWQWVSAVERARSDSQTFDLVMDSMVEWGDTETVSEQKDLLGEDNS